MRQLSLVTIAAMSATLASSSIPCRAQSTGDAMGKDTSAMGAMGHDAMKKDGMAKDGMAKGGMANDGMAKDGMAHDAMGMGMDAMHPAMMSGSFATMTGHPSAGTASVTTKGAETTVAFDQAFGAEKAPDTYVYLSATPDLDNGHAIRVGKLHSTSGEQKYTTKLPADTKVGYEVLWSENKHEAVGTAKLGK